LGERGRSGSGCVFLPEMIASEEKEVEKGVKTAVP